MTKHVPSAAKKIIYITRLSLNILTFTCVPSQAFVCTAFITFAYFWIFVSFVAFCQYICEHITVHKYSVIFRNVKGKYLEY